MIARELHLDCPDLKRLPLDDNIVPVMQAVSPQYRFQHIYLPVNVEVWGYGELGDEGIGHSICLPALLMSTFIEGVWSHVLFIFGVRISQVAIVMRTLVAVVCPRLLRDLLLWDGWLAQLQLRLVASVFHHTSLNSFHLGQAWCA